MSEADKQIDALIGLVSKQRAEVLAAEKLSKKSWVTNCSYQRLSTPINIQTATIQQLMTITVDIISWRNAAAEAAQLLGVPSEADLPINGYTVDQWIADCTKRVANITLAEKKKQLDQLDSRLDKLISPEKRREMELAAIAKELGISS